MSRYPFVDDGADEEHREKHFSPALEATGIQDVSSSLQRAKKSSRGLSAQRAGALHEAWCDIQHARAVSLGLLVPDTVVHNEPKVTNVGGRTIRTGRSVSDYTALLVGGRTLAAEAKSSKTARLAQKKVRKKQAEYLGAVARSGNLAVFLVEFTGSRSGFSGPRRYACPWALVKWETVKSAVSVSEASLFEGGWLVADDGCYVADLLGKAA